METPEPPLHWSRANEDANADVTGGVSSEKPVRWKRNLLFIWLSQILSIGGYASAMPFIPIYIRDRWGITSEHELGLWMSAFYFFGMLSFCVFTPVWGMLADRYGRKLMLLRACYIDAILFPCFLLAPSPFWLIVARFVASAFTGTVSAAQTLIVTTTPEKHHGFALGTLSSAIWSGNLFGFAAGGLIVHWFGFTTAFACCGVMYLLAGILAHLFVEDPFSVREASRAVQGKVALWPGITVGVWMIFLLIILTAIARRFDDPYVALMVEKIHGPERTAFHTGWISAVAALGGIISGMVTGRLCDLFSPNKVALPSILVASGTMFLQAVSGSLPWYAGARFVNFLATGGLEPVFFSILSKVSPPAQRGTYFGLASGLRMTGIMLGSLFSGGIIYFVGLRNVYTAAGILFLIIIPVYYATIRALKKQEPVAGKGVNSKKNSDS
ncbi:MAG: MFS transporter [Planctomycetia bacterium]|nr:MFS transporter [Planctomycetia bacterium]